MAYLTKKQERERFIAEFLRRLREAPPGGNRQTLTPCCFRARFALTHIAQEETNKHGPLPQTLLDGSATNTALGGQRLDLHNVAKFG